MKKKKQKKTRTTLHIMKERKRMKDKLKKTRIRAETSRYQEDYRQKHKEGKKSE